MKECFKNKFQVTDSGAEGIVKAAFSSFLVYVISMLPVMLLMMLGDELILGNEHNKWSYFLFSLLTIIILYMALWNEYEKLYNSTYKESANLRINIAKKLKELPLSYFSKHNLSDLAQSIMSDVEAIEHAMSHSIPKVYGLYFFLPVLAIMLMLGNYKLGIAVILPNVLRFVIISLSKKSNKVENTEYHKVLRDNSEKFQEAIEMHKEIRGFNLANRIKKDLYKQVDYSENKQLKAELISFRAIGISSLFSFVSLGIVMIVGTKLLFTNEINILYLIGYILAAIKLKEMVDVSNESIMEIAYISPRIAKIREINEEELQSGKKTRLNKFDIVLKNVGFSYEGDRNILKDVSFTAKQGEVTALVGPSGCGKTTLLKLISRLYDYNSGEILIDGKDIKEIDIESLFDKISIVFQDVTLFNTSILENIRIGKVTASDKEVKKAAELANCMEFIEKLPKGFETRIGENGAELSGGERQRLSIARAFLKDSPILILDEISANLDVENEMKIQESLNKLIENKTVIIISHRLKSIENVNNIVVLENGYLESTGSHSELLEKSNTYKKLNEKSKMAEEFVY